MADHDLTSPLLPAEPSDGVEVILRIEDDGGNPPEQINNQNGNNHDHTRLYCRNPFAFLGSDGFSVPESTTVDPFRNNTPSIGGVYEWVKIVVCIPIALARLVLFGLCLLVGYLATKTALHGWKDKENPMPKWRCRLMGVTRLCGRCILFSFGYQWITRKGKPAPREIAPIIVSNHVSYIEPIFYFYELFPTMVAAESHDSIPFVGTIIRAMQVIYVDRFSPTSKKHAISEIKRKASCNRFPRVLLFPEGTTTNGRSLISFQLGAFLPGYSIQPVVVHYPHVHFDQSWGFVSLPKLMIRMFMQFHNYLEVEYLPVISPRYNGKESTLEFAKRTSLAMATALNVVQTAHSYGDLMLLTKAAEANQERPSDYMIEISKIDQVSSLEAVDFLDKFLSMNPDSSGRATYNGFVGALRLKPCVLAEEIFSLIDIEKMGTITFKQYLFGSLHVVRLQGFQRSCELILTECSDEEDKISEQKLEEFIKPAIPDLNIDEARELFKLFDTDGDGKISKNDLLGCLRRNPLLIALFSQCLLPCS
ncbi:lysophospholipid acyltransferase LPEAT2-like [Cucurbita maxima]|uniref:Lysophospholipid acyltransferase LPEAT2-like n=1 Tax=Cucurbita maxima TaxID=3661 RepID=A0A6J1IFA2_CUCMA|nr:lysophospholipid acyltransferase LPEAT2-like [Cucurbita maxima]